MKKQVKVFLGFLKICLSALIALQGLWASPAAAIAPEQTNIVVWTVNTALNSQRAHCAPTRLDCNWGKFSAAVASKARCPDVVLGQEIRSVSDADLFKAELDQISPNCGIYRRYFFVGSNPENVGKVAIAWRRDRFVHAQVSGNFDAYNKRELWPVSDSQPSNCTGTKDLSTDDKSPARFVTAVRLLDQNVSGKAIIVGSMHWDSVLEDECLQENLTSFAAGINSRWPGVPVIIGGDHNRNPASFAPDDPTGERGEEERRRELYLLPWYTNFISSTGFVDAIKHFYSTADSNGDGTPDICEQWTYHHDLDSDASNNSCSSLGHHRLDYMHYKGLTINQAFTEKGYVGLKKAGNFYSDHRAIMTRYSY